MSANPLLSGIDTTSTALISLDIARDALVWGAGSGLPGYATATLPLEVGPEIAPANIHLASSLVNGAEADIIGSVANMEVVIFLSENLPIGAELRVFLSPYATLRSKGCE